MEPADAAGHQYHVIDARVNRDVYRFPSLEAVKGRLLKSYKVMMNPQQVFDDMRDESPIYLHQTRVDPEQPETTPDYQVRTYTFQGWDQKRRGDFETEDTKRASKYPRPFRLNMQQNDLGLGRMGLKDLVKKHHKGVIIMMHGYNNGGSIDAGDGNTEIFPDGQVHTQLWPNTRHLYHRYISEADGNPDDYLFLFVRWTGDWGGNGLTQGMFFAHDYGLAHDAGANPLTKLMKDLVEEYDQYDSVLQQGNSQIDRDLDGDGSPDFFIMLQGNSLGGRVMTSMARGLQGSHPLTQTGNAIIHTPDNGPIEFPNHPELRVVFSHSALPSRDFAPELRGYRREDEQGSPIFQGDDDENKKVMTWPSSPLQEEYRGLKLFDRYALCFYSPYDKSGYIFSHRMKKSVESRGFMLGRNGPIPSYNPHDPETIAPLCAIHSGRGTDFQDLWHVQLCGWNVPGQLFRSRATYTHNDFGGIGRWQGVRKTFTLMNIGSTARISEIKEGHIAPMWSRMARYVLSGRHEE